jgi:hypothetical protein
MRLQLHQVLIVAAVLKILPGCVNSTAQHEKITRKAFRVKKCFDGYFQFHRGVSQEKVMTGIFIQHIFSKVNIECAAAASEGGVKFCSNDLSSNGVLHMYCKNWIEINK